MNATREACQAALQNTYVQAGLRVIREGESCQADMAYRWLYGSTVKSPRLFDTFADHPRERTYEKFDGQFLKNGKIDYTTAAGAYQITETTWGDCVKALGLTDFSPESQDLAAVWLIRRAGALEDLIAGRFDVFVHKCAPTWASFPGGDSGQTAASLKRLQGAFVEWGGGLGPIPTPPTPPTVAEAGNTEQETNMGPILAGFGKTIITAGLPAIIEAIPRLAGLFGSGSKVSDRNVKAVEVVAETIGTAIGATNAQQVVEAMADPEKVAVAREAVDQRWAAITDLVEAGGGGIAGAAARDAATRAGVDVWWQRLLLSPSFWALLLMLPLVYIIVLSLVGVIGTATWSEQVRAGIAGMITGTIVGGAAGYYWGQVTSRNRSAPTS